MMLGIFGKFIIVIVARQLQAPLLIGQILRVHERQIEELPWWKPKPLRDLEILPPQGAYIAFMSQRSRAQPRPAPPRRRSGIGARSDRASSRSTSGRATSARSWPEARGHRPCAG